MSASVSINRDEFGAILQDAIDGLPEELREARWLLKERDEVRRAGRSTKRSGSSTRPGCGPSAWSRRTSSCARPGATAEEILEDAERRAAAMRHEAEDYVDRKLAAFEVVLDRTMQTGAEGPRAPPGARPVARSSTRPTPTRAGFFDQDDL